MQSAGTRRFFSVYDPAEIQRNVWFERRCRAGHLQGDEVARLRPEFSFGAETVAKADRAFLALYRRAPEPHEWTTYYLRLLQQIEAEPDSYDDMSPSTEQTLPRYAPQTVALQRVERARGGGRNTMAAALCAFAGLAGIAFYATVTGSDISVGLIVGMALFGVLAVPLTGIISRQQSDTLYVCPECRTEYTSAAVPACHHCLLTFRE